MLLNNFVVDDSVKNCDSLVDLLKYSVFLEQIVVGIEIVLEIESLLASFCITWKSFFKNVFIDFNFYSTSWSVTGSGSWENTQLVEEHQNILLCPL